MAARFGGTLVTDAPAPKPLFGGTLVEGTQFAGEPVAESPGALDTVKDIGVNLALGGAQLISMYGTLRGLLTGEPDNWATKLGEKSQTAYEAELSPGYKALEAGRASDLASVEGEGVGAELKRAGVAMWDTLKSPRLLAGFAMQQAPQFGVVGPAAKGAAVAGEALAARVGQQAGKSVMERKAAELMAKEAGAVAGGVGSEAVLQGADAAQQTQQQLQAIPDAIWQSNPQIATQMTEWDAANEGALPADREAQYAKVKKQAIVDLSQKAFSSSALIAMATAAIPGATAIERKLGGVAQVERAGSKLKKAAISAGGEAAQQGIQEGPGGAGVANLATQLVDPNQSTWEGVGEQAGMGALFGIPGALTAVGEVATDKVGQSARERKTKVQGLINAAMQVVDEPTVEASIEAAKQEVDAEVVAPTPEQAKDVVEDTFRTRVADARSLYPIAHDTVVGPYGEAVNDAIAASAPQRAAEPNDYASTQVNLTDYAASHMKGAAVREIDPDDVHEGKGLEANPHITVKYGLTETATPDAVQKVLEDEGPVTATVGPVEIFSPEGKDYDVVVQSVHSADLTRLNGKIRDAVPNEDTHPEYKPHITLGYVKRGTGEKYANMRTGMEGERLNFDAVEFSDRDENKTPLTLGAVKQDVPEQQLRVETTDRAHPLHARPPGKRWDTDAGSMPGEPSYFLDGDAVTAKAAIIEHHDDQGGVLYEAVDGEGNPIATMSTIEEAAAAAEARFPVSNSPTKEAEKVNMAAEAPVAEPTGSSEPAAAADKSELPTAASAPPPIEIEGGRIEAVKPEIPALDAEGKPPIEGYSSQSLKEKIRRYPGGGPPRFKLFGYTITTPADLKGKAAKDWAVDRFQRHVLALEPGYKELADRRQTIFGESAPLDVRATATPESIHAIADEKGIAWDNAPAFLALTKAVTGKEHIDDLDATQRQALYDHLATMPAKADEKAAKDVAPEAAPVEDRSEGAPDEDRPNDTDTARVPGAEALGGVPADAGVTPEGGGDVDRDSARGGAADVAGDGRTGERGVRAERGAGGGVSEVPVPSGGTGDAGGERDRGVDAGVRPADEPAARGRDTPAVVRAADYVISDADEIGRGGQKAKYQQNVAAIRLVKQLRMDGRNATPEEQATLVKYVGWGGMPQAFDAANDKWSNEYAELKDLLTGQEYEAARASTPNAHYTSPTIVRGIYAALERMGFKGHGRMLEPSAGVGHFIGLMPTSLKAGSKVTAIELDTISGQIAAALYPTQRVVGGKGFQEIDFPNDFFDVAMGNPPFGAERLYDARHKDLKEFSIHNFFFAKSIEKLRPGGVLAMVVSSSMLDKAGGKQRAYFADKVDFLGAIRLPNNAFKENANTEVTTDIVFLQKREEGAKNGGEQWRLVKSIEHEGETIPLNQYFVAHPEMMLGEMRLEGTMYRDKSPALIAPAGQDLARELAAAIERLPTDVYKAQVNPVAEETATSDVDVPHGTKVYSYFTVGESAIAQRLPDVLGEPYAVVSVVGKTKVDRMKGLIGVRDTLAYLMKLELDAEATDGAIEEQRRKLNVMYDRFVAKWGAMHTAGNKQAMREDPEYPRLLSLENKYTPAISKDVAKRRGIEAQPATFERADIFTKRVLRPRKTVASASNGKDALQVVMNEIGRVDVDRMAELVGKPREAIIEELKGLIYNHNGQWVTAEDFLTGNVKKKLAETRVAARADPSLRDNVAALEKVQPADKEAIDIKVELGAPWVPASDVRGFIEDLIGGKATVQYQVGRWFVSVANAAGVKNTETWGTKDYPASELIPDVMTGKAIVVRRKDADGSTYVDKEATIAASLKGDEIKRAFNDAATGEGWLWKDAERRDRLVRIYNDTYNTHRLRDTFDGSYLTLPGIRDGIRPHPHVLNTVARAVQEGRLLIDHAVGAGKTWVGAITAMELRRLGLAKKPMIVVPNHLVWQWGKEIQNLYPGAKLLITSKRDFQPENRKVLMSRIATGDWDAVVVAHSQFGMIPLPPGEESAHIHDMVAEAQAAIDALKTEKGQARTVKQIEKSVSTMMERLKAITDRQVDDTVNFAELGVDALLVDEAHEYKNLFFSTQMGRVAGLGDTNGSKKATDMFVKVRMIQKANAGKNTFLYTGTPISNSMVEMFTVQRYMQYEEMKEKGLHHFDAWASVFGSMTTDWELDSSGVNYKMRTRFRSFKNMSELQTMYRSFADVLLLRDLRRITEARGGKWPVPNIKGGAVVQKVIERSPDQAAFMESIIHRMQNMPSDPRLDNHLAATNDARKMALDMRLVHPGAPDTDYNKSSVTANIVESLYRKWNDDKGVTLVFIDLSTPKDFRGAEAKRIQDLVARSEAGDEEAAEAVSKLSMDEILASSSTFDVYNDIKGKLIAKGIPADEVRFIHEGTTEDKLAKLHADTRDGKIRVLLGSTQKMGTGMNVQERLVGLVNVDAPWRPADIEQRVGRIVRQGNKLYARDPEGFEIEVYNLATKQTYDARMWEILEQKAQVIEQVRSGEAGDVIEDITSGAATFSEMKAAATGNPLIQQQVKLTQQVRELEIQLSQHSRQKHRLEDTIRKGDDLDERVAAYKAQLDEQDAMAKAAEAAPWSVSVGDGEVVSPTPVDPKAEPADRKAAEKANSEARAKVLNALTTAFVKFVAGVKTVDHVNRAFTYRGLTGAWGSTYGNPKVLIKAPGAPFAVLYFESDKFSASGLLTRIDNWLDSGVKDARAIAATEEKKQREDIKEAKAQIGKPFARMAELEEKRTTLAGIMSELQRMQDPAYVPLADRKPGEEFDAKGHRVAPPVTPQMALRSSSMGPRMTRSRPLTQNQVGAALKSAVTRIRRDIGLNIVVTQSAYAPAGMMDEVPEGRVPRGATLGDTIYIFSDHLHSAADARLTLAHELAHFGANQVLGAEGYAAVLPDYARLLQSGKAAGVRFNTILARVREQYAHFEDGSMQQLHEFIALAAEERHLEGPVGRLLTKVRELWAKALAALGLGEFSMTDIDLILSKGERYLRTGQGGHKFVYTRPDLHERQADMTLDAMAKAAPRSDRVLSSIGKTLEKRGLVWHQGPIKSIERIREKMGDESVGNLPDLVRGTILAPEPADFTRAAHIIANHPSVEAVFDKGIVEAGAGYVDGKLLVRLKTGVTAEVQVMPPALFEAKQIGHQQYKELRQLLQTEDLTPEQFNRAQFLEGSMRDLYANAFSNAGAAWSSLANRALQASSERTSESSRSARLAGIQTPSNNLRDAIREADESTSDTAGRPSKSKNENTVITSNSSVRPMPANTSFSLGKALYKRAWRRALGRDFTTAEQVAIEEGGFGFQGPGSTLRQRFARINEEKLTRFRQALVDQFASIRSVLADERTWMLAHLSKSSAGAMEAAIESGHPFLTAEGTIDIDMTQKGLKEILAPLGTDIDRFLMWIAGNRAEKLLGEGRERLLSPANIQVLKDFNQDTPDHPNRQALFDRVNAEFEAFGDAIVKIAEATGLVDPAEAQIWRTEGFYLPFYRVLEEGDVRGPRSLGEAGGLVRQTAYKRLKGGEEMLNDLLGNAVLNWNHLISASLKNQAAANAIGEAINMGIASPGGKATDPNVVFIREAGKAKFYTLDDSVQGELVFQALVALNYEGLNNWPMKAMRAFKRGLTIGVTASPEFKIRNLLRDSIHAIAVADMSTNIAKNIMQGWAATAEGTQSRASMLASGAIFAESGYIHGADPDAIRYLTRRGVERDTILDTRHAVRQVIDRYQDFGTRLENVNRAANYQQAIAGKRGQLQAAFEARDQLDFSRTGNAIAMRVFAQVVPFLNARMQGLDKLARSAVSTDPRISGPAARAIKSQAAQFAVVTGIVSGLSVLLYLGMKDDPDYKEVEEWERDSYWLFKLPGSDTMYRFPKPFEVGAIASLAERAVEQVVDDEAHGALFAERLWFTLTQTFAFNPIPQVFMPALELYANTDTFTGRDIETEGMQNLSPENRKRAWTSETSIAASAGMDAVTWGKVVLSPVQIEHLVQGYMGWLGATALAGSDALVRTFTDSPARPSMKLADYPVLKAFVKAEPARNTKYTTQFYKNLEAVTQAYGDYKQAVELNELDKADTIEREQTVNLGMRKFYNRVADRLSKINKEMTLIQTDRTLSPAEKREQLDGLTLLKNEMTRTVAEERDTLEAE